MARPRRKAPTRRRPSTRTPPTPPDLGSPELYLNRELSWLDFNQRVLEEANDAANPLIERLRFVAIFGSNLDEFFMKRIGGLKQQVASNLREASPDGRTPRQQLEAIEARVRPMVAEQHRIFGEELRPALRRRGLEILTRPELRAAERRWLERFFLESVFPILTPIAVDPAHPFPFLSNLSLSLGVALRHPVSGERRFGRVKVPPQLPRFIELPAGVGAARFLALEEVIALYLDRLFPGTEILEAHPFRVTRSADLQIDDDPADDLLEVIEEELRELRFARVVRLQVTPEMPAWMRALLCQELSVGTEEVYEMAPPLGLAGLSALCAAPLPALKYAPWRPVTPPRLAVPADAEPVDIFREIARRDLLVHHPYDSFASSVQRFIQAAARDPQVVAIKQTLYRTQHESPIVAALVEAAESGKHVAVTVELKARFDEARNIEWARQLEEAGAHVAYGVVGLKTHAKVALVVRQEGRALKSYAHIATGNYNAETANFYTDLGLLTARADVARDVGLLFNLLTGFVVEPRFEKLLVAPATMRRRFEELIEREIEHQKAGRGGRIVAKMNSLEDSEMVQRLYAASRAGVEIDLVVRGLCRLRPGLEGVSDRIRVISIVGRFLEHSRIFLFGNGGAPEVFLGSADWMARNLNGRVEAITPVEEPALRDELRSILDIHLADNAKAWDLHADGRWTKRVPPTPEERRSSQELLMARAMGKRS
jgi:polyphosphate kinase